MGQGSLDGQRVPLMEALVWEERAAQIEIFRSGQAACLLCVPGGYCTGFLLSGQ